MARVIKNNPIYTVDGILNAETKKGERIVRDRGSQMERLGQYLKLAEAVVTSKAVGGVANLIGKGVGALGDAAEQAATVAHAKRLTGEQQELNQTENAALKAKAMERLAASRAISASGDAELKMGEQHSSDKKAYFQGLKEQQGTFDPGNTKPMIEYLRKGIAAGYLDERDAEGFTKMLVEKVGDPTMAEYEKQEAGLLVKEGQLRNTLKVNEQRGSSSADDMERLAELEEDPAIRQGLLEDAAEFRSKNAADLEKWTDKAVDTPVVKPPVVAKEYFPESNASVDIMDKITERGPDAVKRAIITLKNRNNPRDKELYTKLVDHYTNKYGKGAVPKETAEQEIFAPEAARIAAVDADVAGMNTAADALMQRKAVLPEGVTYDEATGAYTFPVSHRLGQSEILALASGADSPEKRASVLRAIEDGNVSSTSLFDMMTGGHKKRLALEAAKLFPKIPAAQVTKITKTPEQIAADIALSGARKDKLVAETKEIPTDSESERDKRAADAAGAAARAEDLKDKGEASAKGVNYWKSVIIKNLRKPAGRAGRSGKTPAEVAKDMIKQLEKDRDRIKRGIDDKHDDVIKGTEREVNNLVAKKTQLLSATGANPTPPTEPNMKDYGTSKALNDANKTYTKDNKEYLDKVRAIKAINEQIGTSTKKLESEQKKKRDALASAEKAFEEVIVPLKDKAGLPQSPNIPSAEPTF